MVTVVFTTIDLFFELMMLAVLFLIVLLGRIYLGNIAIMLSAVAPLCFFITLIQALGQPGHALYSANLWGVVLNITKEGMVLGLAITLRVILLAMIMITLFSALSPIKLTKALYDLGMSFKYAYAFAIALRFLPLVLEELAKITDAQRSRGYDIDRVNPLLKPFKIFPLLIPLLLSCLRRASTIALAMDLKAFNAFKERTFFIEVNKTTVDYVFRIVSIIVAAFFVGVAVISAMGVKILWY